VLRFEAAGFQFKGDEALQISVIEEQIQFTAPDKSLGVANRDLAVIEGLASDGLVAAPRQQPAHPIQRK
jgi:hypothetical protein